MKHLKAILFTFLSLTTLNADELSSLINKAESFFENGDFQNSSEIYQTISQRFSEDLRNLSLDSHVNLRLAHSKLLEKKYQEALDLLLSNETLQPVDNIPNSGFLILGMIYRELEQWELALEYLLHYKKLEKGKDVRFVDNEIDCLLSKLEDPELIEKEIKQGLSKDTIQLILKAKIKAHFSKDTAEDYTSALKIIDSLTEDKVSRELNFLQGVAFARLGSCTKQPLFWDKALEAWTKNLKDSDSESGEDTFLVLSLNEIATLYFQREDFEKAELAFLDLYQKSSHNSWKANALFFASVAAEKQMKGREKVVSYRKELLEKFPYSTYAAEAYLNLYTFAEYLHGEETVFQHLQNMAHKYPLSPHLIVAHYLMGMSWKKDHFSFDKSCLRKKNLIKAIDSFQNAETTFDNLYSSELIPKKHLSALVSLRYHSIIERSLVNRAIALSSKGAKRQVYLEYAIDVLLQAYEELTRKENHLAPIISKEMQFHLEEEINLNLALAFSNAEKKVEAQKKLEQMLQQYDANNITKGYFLSRTFYELASLYLKEKKFEEALKLFNQSEDAAKGKVLTKDQQLDLWIHQSSCYRELHQYEEAMKILSRVVNEDAISQLRLKGMFLRAEIYEEQERKDLAQRQLEFLANKGGEWAAAAKEKLRKNYGY